MPAVDVAPLLEEDLAREAAQGHQAPYRFGVEHTVTIGMDQGIWTELPAGDRIWRLAITCPLATSIGLLFSEYVIPEGALVFLYNDAGVQHGAFMAAPNGRTSMAMDQVPGERIIIEYFEPAAVAGLGSLGIGRITHAYREHAGRDLGDSAECHVNVICPQGNDHRDQIRSVALVNLGSSYCTGTLLNNCEDDATPYLLTSNQCLSGDPANWVFRFNFDSPECDTLVHPNFNNSISGADVLAAEPTTDAALLLLHEVPPPYYQVYFSGWDVTGIPPGSGTSIHHPVADVKKISRSFEQVTPVDTLPVWQVNGWFDGIMESGSTGAGLWAENGLLVGNYITGFSDCDTSFFELFGRFDLAYPEFSEFLGTCTQQMPGLHWDPIIPIVHDASITSITNVPALLCDSNTIAPTVTLKNNGMVVLTTAIIQYGVAGGLPEIAIWNGSLLPGQTANYQLPTMQLPPGDHQLVIASFAPNGEDDDWPFNNAWTFDITVNAPTQLMTMYLTLDNYGSDVTWELQNETGTTLYSGGPYEDGTAGTQVIGSFCLTNGCYTFIIEDLFGDGICCDHGEGGYIIQIDGGEIYAESDGQYEFENVDVFCLMDVSVPEAEAQAAMELYPNPTTGMLNIVLEEIHGPVVLTMCDGLGRVVTTRRLAENERMLNMDLSSYAEGVYMIGLDTDNGRMVRRVVLQK